MVKHLVAENWTRGPPRSRGRRSSAAAGGGRRCAGWLRPPPRGVCKSCKENRWPGSPAPALRCLSQRGQVCGESREESIWRRQQEYLDRIKKTKRMMSSIVSVLPGGFSPGDLFPFLLSSSSWFSQVPFYRRGLRYLGGNRRICPCL